MKFFSANGDPRVIVESIFKSFLNSKLTSSPPLLTARKKRIYFDLPYFGHASVRMNIFLCNLITECFAHVKSVGE